MFNLKKKQETEENENFIKFGENACDKDFSFEMKDSKILPMGLEIDDHRYIKLDGKFITMYALFNLPYQVSNSFFDEVINLDEGIELFIKNKWANKQKIIREITQYIGFTNVKKEEGENQVDSEVIESALNHSKYLKKGLANGNEFYYIYPIVRIIADSLEELKKKDAKAESLLSGKDIIARRADFKHLETFLTCIPGLYEDKGILNAVERNILSNDLSGLYPFKEKTHDDICYSCVCTKQSEIDKIKEMDLKKGDTIQLVGILSSETYEKNSKKVVKPKYFIDYLDPKKNKEASLYKFVDDDMSESINRFNELKMQELQQTKADKSAEMTMQF